MPTRTYPAIAMPQAPGTLLDGHSPAQARPGDDLAGSEGIGLVQFRHMLTKSDPTQEG